MDVASFFEYPEDSEQTDQDLVFLGDWSQDNWAKLLSYTEVQRYSAGSILINIGDADRTLYLVVSGVFKVLVPRRRGRPLSNFRDIGAGSVVGEQSFFDARPRSALVQALSDCEVLRLGFEAFEVFAAREPLLAKQFLIDLGRILSLRLRQRNAIIETLVR